MMYPQWKELCTSLRETLKRNGWNERRTTEKGQEESGFVVLPRSDGGCAIYFLEAYSVPFRQLEKMTAHHLEGYQQTLSREGVQVEMMEPTCDGAQCWLLYVPAWPTDARKLLATALA